MSTDDPATRPRIRADLDHLVAFLLARLDDDEEAARTQVRGGEILPFESITQTADHGARHGPLRVLREVAAKRAAVQMWRDAPRVSGNRLGAGRADVVDALIVVMATVFAEHPDFDPTWLAAPEEPDDKPGNLVPLPGI
jgi:hypothetical protein